MGKYKKVPYEKSFGYYIEIELGLNLDDIWNWKKNNELGINPYEISRCGTKKVWLYCREKDYHNYDREGNKIGYKIQCSNFYNGSRCGYCGHNKTHWKDSLAYNYPQYAKMIAIKENNLTFEDCYNVACSSNKRFYFKCLDCGSISNKKIVLSNMIKGQYLCEFCSDGIPTTEKFMGNVLKQLNESFVFQLNKSNFKWCGNFRYDFYIYSKNMIIETNGEQHYISKNNSWRALRQEQMNDLFKYKCAKNHVDNYIVIDCRYSTLEWMKENIIKELSSYLNLSNVNWELAWEESQNSLCVKAWELWNSGIHSTTRIGEILNLNRNTVRDYLKKGVECGKCDYTKEESMKNRENGKNHYRARSIICITTKRIFFNLNDALKFYNIKSNNITACCKNKRNYCGKLKDGTKLKWKYLKWNHNKRYKIKAE